MDGRMDGQEDPLPYISKKMKRTNFAPKRVVEDHQLKLSLNLPLPLP